MRSFYERFCYSICHVWSWKDFSEIRRFILVFRNDVLWIFSKTKSVKSRMCDWNWCRKLHKANLNSHFVSQLAFQLLGIEFTRPTRYLSIKLLSAHRWLLSWDDQLLCTCRLHFIAGIAILSYHNLPLPKQVEGWWWASIASILILGVIWRDICNCFILQLSLQMTNTSSSPASYWFWSQRMTATKAFKFVVLT